MRGFCALDEPMRSRVQKLHQEAPFTDIHTHVAMTPYLCNKPLWYEGVPMQPQRPLFSGPLPTGLVPRADFVRLRTGGVSVAWIAHHVPERQMFEQCWAAKLAAHFTKTYKGANKNKSIWQRLQDMVQMVESAAAQEPDKFIIARSAADLDRPRKADSTLLIHTLEGFHHVTDDLDISKPSSRDVVKERIKWLKSKGFASIIITHFYHIGLVSPNNAIPPGTICKFKTGAYEPPILTSFGEFVIAEIQRAGMILDLMHCSSEARKAVLDHPSFIDGTAQLPAVIASHTAPWGDEFTKDQKEHGLSPEDILRIKDRGGLVGVIFFPHWLTSEKHNTSAQLAVEAMRRLYDIAKTWDVVAIGSDLDGFTDTFDEIRDAADMPLFTRMLIDNLNVDDGTLKKILGENARRVLKDNWK